MDNQLSDKHITFIALGALVGYGIMSLPKEIAEYVGTSGWITILMSMTILLVVVYFLTTFISSHKNMTIFDLSKKLLGTYASFLIAFIYFSYFVIIISMNSRRYCDLIKLTMLPNTPYLVLILALYILLYYVVTKGIFAVAGLSELYCIIGFIAIVLIYSITLSMGDTLNLRPLIYTKDPMAYFSSLQVTLSPFLGFEVLFCLPLSQNKNRLFKSCSLTIAISGFIYFFVYEACIAVIGIDDIIHYNATLLTTLSSITVPYLDIFKRLDLLGIIVWSIWVLNSIIIWCYACTTSLNYILKKADNRYIVFFTLFLSLGISMVPKNAKLVVAAFRIIEYGATFTVIIIPLFLYIIMKVKKA